MFFNTNKFLSFVSCVIYMFYTLLQTCPKWMVAWFYYSVLVSFSSQVLIPSVTYCWVYRWESQCCLLVITHTPSVPKKTNLLLDVIYSSAMNLDRDMSKFIILGCVTFSIRLVFYRTEGVRSLFFRIFFEILQRIMYKIEVILWHK